MWNVSLDDNILTFTCHTKCTKIKVKIKLTGKKEKKRESWSHQFLYHMTGITRH